MSESNETLIAEDVEITGSIKCSANIRINGKLNGDLTCSGDAVIGQSAAVKGNLTVSSLSVEGQLNGNVTAKDKLELKSTAKITGDVRAKRMTVEDGVTFVGKAEVTPSGRASTDGKTVQEIAPPDEQEDQEEEKEEKSGKLFGKK